MRKAEMRAATDSDIIYDYVQSYAQLCLNYNQNRGVKALEKHVEDLNAEVLRRGLLTPEQVKKLNA